MPDAPLAPVPSEILDQFARQGPISVEELDAAVRWTTPRIIEMGPAARDGVSGPNAFE
jgi:hypothetical protein